MKKLMIITLAALILLASCAKAPEDSASPTEQPSASVAEAISYSPLYIPIPSKIRGIYDLRTDGDALSFIADTNGGARQAYSIDPESAVLTPQGDIAAPEGYLARALRTNDAGKRFFVDPMIGIAITDTDGENVAEFHNEKMRCFMDLVTLRDGSVAVVFYSLDGSLEYAIAVLGESGMIEHEYEIQTAITTAESFSEEFDFYRMDNKGIYGCSINEMTSVPLLTLAKVGIAPEAVTDFAVMQDGTVYCALFIDNCAELVRLSPGDAIDKSDKTTLRLASMGDLSSLVAAQVAKFNRENDEFEIVVENYKSLFSMGIGVNHDMITEFSLMLISGNAPDIVMQNTRIPQDVYTKKGVFEDLYPYLEREKDIEILPAVLKALEKDGKLYQIVPDFTVYTATAPVSSSPGQWTLEDALAYDGIQLLAAQEKSSLMEYLLIYYSSEFIDYGAGTCDFENEDFVQLLEFVATFPDENPYIYEMSDLMEGTYITTPEIIMRGEAVAASSAFFNYTDYHNLLEQYGEQVEFVGMPRVRASVGGVFSAIAQGVSISASSKNKDAAWSFVRTLLTEEFQQQRGMISGLPTNVNALSSLAEQAMMCEDDPMTQQEIDDVNNLINSIEKWERVDYKLLDIISEEAALYFNGRVEAQEAAAAIQSRAGIYLSEQS